MQAQAPQLRPDDVPADKAFPFMTGDDVQQYQGLFGQIDVDRDGYVLVSNVDVFC